MKQGIGSWVGKVTKSSNIQVGVQESWWCHSSSSMKAWELGESMMWIPGQKQKMRWDSSVHAGRQEQILPYYVFCSVWTLHGLASYIFKSKKIIHVQNVDESHNINPTLARCLFHIVGMQVFNVKSHENVSSLSRPYIFSSYLPILGVQSASIRSWIQTLISFSNTHYRHTQK